MAVACKRVLRLSKNPKTEKISVHNPFIFNRLFSMKMPKSDFFDSLVRQSYGRWNMGSLTSIPDWSMRSPRSLLGRCWRGNLIRDRLERA
jgi:hypothetical protein